MYDYPSSYAPTAINLQVDKDWALAEGYIYWDCVHYSYEPLSQLPPSIIY